MRAVVHFDGGARKGHAASGAVCETSAGTTTRNGYIGEATVPVAEYMGLLMGISLAIESGATDLSLYGDAKLIVYQMTGAYKTEDPKLLPLRDQAVLLLNTSFRDRWTIAWAPREENGTADALVNAALEVARLENDEIPPASGRPRKRKEKVDAIEAAISPSGGWTRAQLSEWGVPWPPPKGWKRRLEAEFRRSGVLRYAP